MKWDFPEREMRVVAELEECYRWVAELVKPSELEEDPLPAARVYMSALRSLERCVELRMKLVREADGMPEPEPEEPVAKVDLSRLSDGALREVERAMVPSTQELQCPEPSAPEPSTPEPSTQELQCPEPSTQELQCPEPSTQEPDGALPEGAQGTDGAENGGDDRNRSCEKKICAAVEPPKITKKRTAAARPRGSRSGPARGPGSGSRNKSPSSG